MKSKKGIAEDLKIGLKARQFNLNMPKNNILLGDKWFSKVIRRVGFHKAVKQSKLLTSSKGRILFHLTIHLHKLFFNIFPGIHHCDRFAFSWRFTTFFYKQSTKEKSGFFVGLLFPLKLFGMI